MTSTPSIGSPLIVVVVNRSWRWDMTPGDTYRAAQGPWRVGAAVRREAKLAIAVAHGRIVGVYDIDRWDRVSESEDSRDRPVVKYAFTGSEADDLLYILGSRMESLPTKHQSSFLKFLDGYPG